MLARLIRDEQPGATVTLQHGRLTLTAVADPLAIGADRAVMLLERPRLVWQLLDERSRVRAMLADPMGREVIALLDEWCTAAGLSFFRLAVLRRVLDHIDALEVDLLRMGLDIRDWLDPAGPLSTRRVLCIAEDLENRPESAYGAAVEGLFPLTKDALLLAQILEALTHADEPHGFRKTRAELEAVARQRAEDAAKRERIAAQQRTVVAPAVGAMNFDDARAQSQRELAALLAERA